MLLRLSIALAQVKAVNTSGTYSVKSGKSYIFCNEQTKTKWMLMLSIEKYKKVI